MRNKKLINSLLIIVLIPTVSIFTGYMISQHIIKPYLDKHGSNAYLNNSTIEIHGIDLYQIIIGEYADFDDAKYNYDLLKMKNIYSRIYKSSQKYLLVVGVFLNKDDANSASKFFKSYGINSSIYLYKGPAIRIEYDKKETNDILEFEDCLNRFKNSLASMSFLSGEALYSTVKESDAANLESEVHKSKVLYKNTNYNININKIKFELNKINDILIGYIKNLRISADLQDKNSYELLQNAIWESSNRYNDLLNELAKKNQ